jgi:hypothetical protein
MRNETCPRCGNIETVRSAVKERAYPAALAKRAVETRSR